MRGRIRCYCEEELSREKKEQSIPPKAKGGGRARGGSPPSESCNETLTGMLEINPRGDHVDLYHKNYLAASPTRDSGDGRVHNNNPPTSPHLHIDIVKDTLTLCCWTRRTFRLPQRNTFNNEQPKDQEVQRLRKFPPDGDRWAISSLVGDARGGGVEG